MLPLMVTGGCGFIGSNFIRHLLETDPDLPVLNFDALTYAGNPANLADLEAHPRYRFIQADICDRASVRDPVAGVRQLRERIHRLLPGLEQFGQVIERVLCLRHRFLSIPLLLFRK